jgi:polar amino acid transport system substrate-binding protein
MKKILFLIVMIAAVGGLFSFVSDNAAAQSKVITIRADIWPPYNDAPNAKMQGSMVDIVRHIFEKQGYTIDYQLMPWNRSIEEVEKGAYDAIIGASSEGPTCITPKEAIGVMENHLFVKKGTAWRYTGPDSLKTAIIGVIADYTYAEGFDAYVAKNKNNTKKIDVMFGDSPLEKNIQKLQAGRITAIVENPLVFQWVAVRNMGLKMTDFEDVGTLENSKLNLYIKFTSKKDISRTYADIFDRGIAELRRSGELKKILDKYGMRDWK